MVGMISSRAFPFEATGTGSSDESCEVLNAIVQTLPRLQRWEKYGLVGSELKWTNRIIRRNQYISVPVELPEALLDRSGIYLRIEMIVL